VKTEAEIRAEWLAQLHSTAPADRPRAEAGVRALYAAAGYPEARHLVWFDSPFAASWAVAVLAERHHFLWAQKMAAAAKSRDDRAEMDRARATLGAQLGLPNWEAVVTAFGAPMGSSVQFPAGARTYAQDEDLRGALRRLR